MPIRCLTVVALLLASFALAQERYVDPDGRFDTPVPAGWELRATPDVLTLTHADPVATIHLLAQVGAEDEVVAAALAILVDPSLDASFAAAPLQASPVALPNGTWTQRLYQVGDDIVAAISLERGGFTVLLLAQATQEAFMQVANAAVNQMLLGMEVLIAESVPTDPSDLPYAVHEVELDAGTHVLAGTLTHPEGDGPFAGVVLVSGSGAQDRDGANPSLPGYTPSRWLADHLTRAGLAVLRMDERGVGGSSGDLESATTADLADDVATGLRWLADLPEVDAGRVGLLGHSEGGVIVGRIAAAHPDEVAFVVLMAGPALPYSELVVLQVERITAAAGADADAVAAAVTQQREVVSLVLAEDWDGLAAMLDGVVREQIAALPESQREQLGDLDAFVETQVRAGVEAFRSPWLSYFFDYDPRVDLRRVQAPVLALFGGLDVQVDVEANRPALEAALTEAGNDDLHVVIFDDANHLFQRAVSGGPDEYLALEMAFVDGFLEAISDWLTDRFAR